MVTDLVRSRLKFCIYFFLSGSEFFWEDVIGYYSCFGNLIIDEK